MRGRREEGQAEAKRIRAFFEHVSPLEGGGGALSVADKLRVWETLRKREALHELAQGKAQCKLYFTPADVDLSIQNREVELPQGLAGSESSYVRE